MPAAPEALPLLEPREAIDFFRAKGFKVGFAWQDVWQEEHARAFTVAKAMRRDILETIRAALDDAISKGLTLAQFRAQVTPLLQAKGWWGRQRMIDPATGQDRMVQLGSPRRLKIIYDMNMRMAQAAGRWDRIQRAKGALPYLRYTAVMDDRTRPEHAAWHGTILHVDDPWWDTHYPPCGWNCRCTVIQLDAETIDEQGWTIDVAPPPAGRPQPYSNPRTGEVSEVPAGFDPGFVFNVGKAWLGGIEPPPLLPPDLPALEPGVASGAPPAGAPHPKTLLAPDVTDAVAVEAFVAGAGLGEPLVSIGGVEVAPAGAKLADVRDGARAWLKGDGAAGVRNPELGEIRVTQRGVKKMASTSQERYGGEDKLRATPAVKSVIERGQVAILPNFKAAEKPMVTRIARIHAPVRIGGERRVMEVLLEERPDGWMYYNHRLPEAQSGRPHQSGVVSVDAGTRSIDGLSNPKSGSRSAIDIGTRPSDVESKFIADPTGWPLPIGKGWFRGVDGALAMPTGDRRRVLGLVGRALASPAQIRLRWVTGADGRPMLFRRYIAKIDGLTIVVDVGREGWRFATERDPGFDIARLATGTLIWPLTK